MMETTIKRCYGTLKVELERAKQDLRGVEENIKKMIGRDPSEGLSQRYCKCFNTLFVLK